MESKTKLGPKQINWACEYLLLELADQKIPAGLTSKEIISELFRRGIQDTEMNSWLDPDNIVSISTVRYYVYLFCDYHLNRSLERQMYIDLEDKKSLMNMEGDGNFGHILFNWQNEDKYRFYNGYNATPMSWGFSINLIDIGKYISNQEIWLKPKKHKQFESQENLYFAIATWFSNKFKKPFYEIYSEAADYYDITGRESLLLEQRLSSIKLPC